MKEKKYLKVTTTFLEYADALAFVNAMINLKLVVDGQINEIFSIFEFEGNLHQRKEFSLSMKTEINLQKEVEIYIKKNHPYKVAEIVFSQFVTSKDYGKWIESYVKTPFEKE